MLLRDFYFRGAQTVKEAIEVNNMLTAYEVFCQNSFDSEIGLYYVDRDFLTYLTLGDRTDKPILSCNDFISLLKDNDDNIRQELWWLELKLGMEVTIDERVTDGSDYPFHFSDDMEDFIGNTYTIDNINKSISRSSPHRSRNQFNGDPKSYYLKGNANGYTWHSSMFVPLNVNPVKTVELTNIQVLKTLL